MIMYLFLKASNYSRISPEGAASPQLSATFPLPDTTTTLDWKNLVATAQIFEGNVVCTYCKQGTFWHLMGIVCACVCGAENFHSFKEMVYRYRIIGNLKQDSWVTLFSREKVNHQIKFTALLHTSEYLPKDIFCPCHVEVMKTQYVS